MTYDSRYFIEALHRGLRILEAFSDEKPSLTLVEIAKAVGLDKSTAFRFVYTLEELGYLERNPESKRYRPGLKTLSLGFTALSNIDFVQRARQYLKDLSEETGEAVNMALRDGREIVYVARISPRQIVNINLQVGSRLPVHCTSMGKVQLIDLPPEELEALLGQGPYEALTPHTITTLAGLVAEMDEIRQRGYAVGDEELAVGVRSLAAPVRNADGQIVAGINVSVSSARLSRDEMKEQLSEPVLTAGRRISYALGATA